MGDPVPFIDLRAQHATIAGEIREAVDRVFASQQFILGDEVSAFEAALAERLGLPPEQVIGVSSGTDALLVSLMALGVCPGDHVLTTPFSFFATGGVVARLHATPVFVDIDPVTLDLDTARLASLDPSAFRAVIAVDMFGRAADLAALRAWADPAGLPVIEDAAQAIGARCRDGRPCGTGGDLGCFSFFPTKNLGGAGDGGAVAATDAGLAERVRLLRTHGAAEAYQNLVIGGNFRLDALQAAVLGVKLRHLDAWNAARLENARAYDEAFRDLPGITPPPFVDDGTWNVHQYVLRARDRDGLRAHLAEAGIGSAVYYPTPFHRMPAFASLGHADGAFPQAEAACREVLALPVFAELGEARRERVIEAVKTFAGRS